MEEWEIERREKREERREKRGGREGGRGESEGGEWDEVKRESKIGEVSAGAPPAHFAIMGAISA